MRWGLGRVAMDWRLRSRTLRLGEKTLVMGIVNITPDSFSDGGRYLEPEQAVEQALRLLDEGADLLDLGAESTRPGVRVSSKEGEEASVSANEEQARLIPVLEMLLRERPETVISADTYKASTARAAVAAGAEIVNDVSGLLWDPAMGAACAELGCGVVLMHTRGTPDVWRTEPALERGTVVPLVLEGLGARLKDAQGAGVASEALVLDPGYGFGKRFDENYELLAGQSRLLALGRPLLAGISRKSFLRRTVHERAGSAYGDVASMAGVVATILAGASVVRVHEVREAVEAAAIADAVLAGDAG